MDFLQSLVAAIVITFWNFDYCSTSDIRGKYYIESQKIEVCQVEDKNEKYFYALHEIGHFFWFKYLTEDEKTLYNILFENSNILDFYREYSKTNAEEDFADNFALIYIKRNIEPNGRIYKAKNKFIIYLINKYDKSKQ